MNRDALIEHWKREENEPFQGWNFSHLEGRVFQENLPWDYVATARARVADARSILDMATGGGEVFSKLGPFQGSATAMEGYAPNVALAEKRLQPLGVKVVACGEAGPYPFADSSFDLVLNRHGGLWSPEVGRITRDGAYLVTEQVGGCLEEVQSACGAPKPWAENTLPFVSEKLSAQGFKILEGRTWTGKIHYQCVFHAS